MGNSRGRLAGVDQTRHTFKIKKLSSWLAGIAVMMSLGACGDDAVVQADAIHLERARVYQAQGQYKAATIEYRNAMKKTQGAVDVVLPYADMLQLIGYYPTALELLEQLPESARTEAYYLELVETYIGLNKFSTAERIFSEHVKSTSIHANALLGQIHYGLGNVGQADKLFSQILKTEPANGIAVLGKSMILLKSDRMDETFVLLNALDSSSAQYIKAQLLISGIQITRGQMEAAEATLTQVLTQLPNTDQMISDKAVVLERLAYVLTRQGRPNEAYIYTKLLSEAFPGSSEASDKIKQAYDRFQANDLDAAKALLIDVLEDFPTHAKAKQTLGIIAYVQGDLDTASNYLSDSVDPEVADPLTTQIYAAASLRLNNPGKVLEILEDSIQTSTSAPTWALYGISALAEKQTVKGESALKKAIELDPNNVRYRIALASFYRDSKAADAAAKELAQLELAYAIEPASRILLQELLGYHYRHGGEASAQKFVETQLANHPKAAATHLIAGYYQANSNNLDKAYEYFVEASKLVLDGEDRLIILSAKGKVELKLKKYDVADKTFSDIIRFYPQSDVGYSGIYAATLALKQDEELANSRLVEMAKRNASTLPLDVLVRVALTKGDTAAARSYLAQMREIKPKDTQSYAQAESRIAYTELNIAIRKGDFDTGRRIVADRLVKDPEDMRLLSTLVEIEIGAGQFREAEKVIQQMEGINTQHPFVFLLKGHLELARENLAGAREFYEQAWKVQPTELSAERLHRVLLLQKDSAAQLAHVNNWLQQLPDSLLGLQSKAMYHQQLSENAAASKAYEKMLTLQPSNVLALNNLGWIYFETGNSRSLELLKRAVDLAPESPAVLDSYGWVLAKSGQVKDGILYLEKAAKLAPEVQEIKDHLTQAKKM